MTNGGFQGNYEAVCSGQNVELYNRETMHEYFLIDKVATPYFCTVDYLLKRPSRTPTILFGDIVGVFGMWDDRLQTITRR